MKLLIRNLARTTTEAELREIFEAYGTVKSSLKFLRKTPWARKKVEGFYLRSLPTTD